MSLTNINNGDKGHKIREALNNNFRYLDKYLKNYIMMLTSSQRKTISSDYLSGGMLSFDPDEQIWYQYNNGTWEKTSLVGQSLSYSQDISSSDWIGNQIIINYETHLVSNPTVQIYMESNGRNIPVLGGYEIDEDNNIVLTTDMAYQGKVVIK